MIVSMIGLATSDWPPRWHRSRGRHGSGRPRGGPGTQTVAFARTTLGWDGTALTASVCGVGTVAVSPGADCLDRLRDLDAAIAAEGGDSPAILATIGGTYFLPRLRRYYLAADIPAPRVLGLENLLPARERGAGTLRWHIDFGRGLACETGAELAEFLESCNVPPIQAQRATTATEVGGVLRAIAAFHLGLRVLQAGGRLRGPERRRAEDSLLDVAQLLDDDAGVVSAAFGQRQADAHFNHTHERFGPDWHEPSP